MLKEGLFIELRWYKQMMLILSFNEIDYLTLEKLSNNFTKKNTNNLKSDVKKNLNERNKWYLYALDNNIYKHIKNKCRKLVPILIKN